MIKFYIVLPIYLLVFSVFSHALTLDDVKNMQKSGVPQLALELVQQHQPTVLESSEKWQAWEKQRIVLLQQLGLWKEVIARLSNNPLMQRDFQIWALTNIAKAQIEVGNAELARIRLTSLMWSSSVEERKKNLPVWRSLLIKAYLAEGLFSDAYVTLRKYQFDYLPEQTLDDDLHMEVLLKNSLYREAIELIGDKEDIKSQILKLYLVTVSSGMPFEDVTTAVQKLDSDVLDAELKRLLRLVEYLSAGSESRIEISLAALEHVIALQLNTKAHYAEIIPVEKLRQEYHKYAVSLANEQQLLVGSYEGWVQYAEALIEKSPLKTRALLMYLMKLDDRSLPPVLKDKVEKLLAKSFQGSPHLALVLRQLYSDENGLNIISLPDEVKHLLLPSIVESKEFSLAASVVDHLAVSENEVSSFEWNIYKAHLLILGGDENQGIDVIKSVLLSEHDTLKVEKLFPVFDDLLAKNKQVEVLQFLNDLLFYNLSEQQKSQLYVKMANLHFEQQDFINAAKAYILSGLIKPETYQQSIHLKAAESLSKAGFLEDAINQYMLIYKRTTDETLKVQILNRVDRIRH